MPDEDLPPDVLMSRFEAELRAAFNDVIGQQLVNGSTCATVRAAFCQHFDHALRRRGCSPEERAELLDGVVAEVDPEDDRRIVVRTTPELQKWLDLRPFEIGEPPV